MRQTAVPKGVIPVSVPRRPHLLLPVALALALGLLLAACGSSGDEVVSSGDADTTDTTAPDTDVTSMSLPGTGGGDVSWERIEPTDDLVNPTVTEPTELLVDPDDDSTVLVRFYGGVQDCYGARVTVDETEDAVEVTLETGSRADAGDRACIEIAQAQELAVELDAPLGDRALSAAS